MVETHLSHREVLVFSTMGGWTFFPGSISAFPWLKYPFNVHLQGRKKPRSDCPGQVNFALGHLGQVKMEFWWSIGKVKLASVILLMTLSSKT